MLECVLEEMDVVHQHPQKEHGCEGEQFPPLEVVRERSANVLENEQ
jgi:hypothetical protein